MNYYVYSINHHLADVSVRGYLSLDHTEQQWLLNDLRGMREVKEAIVLSTCHRTEIYISTEYDEIDSSPILSSLFNVKSIQPWANLERYFLIKEGEEAIRYLFRVVSGLESMVIGEKQILGQFKRAIELARDQNMMNKRFNILSNLAGRLGKKVRSETNIGVGGSSIGWAAIELAEKKFNTLDNKNVLIIGAGKMSKIALKQLSKKGVHDVYVVNRTFEHARDLALDVIGQPLPLSEIRRALTKVDLCICSCAADEYLITKELFKDVTTRLLIIDISVPSNVDPAVSAVDNIELYNIDDLVEITSMMMERRVQSIPIVERMIEEKMKEYDKRIGNSYGYHNKIYVPAAC